MPDNKSYGNSDVSQSQTTSTESRSLPVWLIALAGMALVIVIALANATRIEEFLIEADGDDLMRLVGVRDWLAGQSWFDTHQYRVLPPDGISMHWSRYIDAAIAAVILAAPALMPQFDPELVAVVVWPSFLACLMVLVLVHGTSRLLGKAATLGALAVFLGWGKLGGEFVPPRIDHHGVQILCATSLFYLSLVPGRARLLGALGGLVTAMSLAVGLEMLPYLATIWGLMALRNAFGQEGTGDWLLGFGLSLTVAAPLLMAGQTPMSEWAVLYCDELAPPVMALGAVGVVATLVPVFARRLLAGPLSRIGVQLAITGVGLWLAYPLLGQCLAGPYSDVSPEVRDIIQNNVIEALSAVTLLGAFPGLLGRVLLPPLIIAVLALGTLWLLRHRINRVQAMALGQAFLIVALGFGFGVIQIRAANLMTPAVPFLAGFLLHGFVQIPRRSLWRLPAVLVLLLSMPTVVEKLASRFMRLPVTPEEAAVKETGTISSRNCRTPEALAEIGRQPKALIFSNMNLGPAILAYTPHSITSAGYHRSIDAYWNGIGSFTTEKALYEALAKSQADYLVLCLGSKIETKSPVAAPMLEGELPDWLTDVTQDRTLVRVLKIDKARFASVAP